MVLAAVLGAVPLAAQDAGAEMAALRQELRDALIRQRAAQAQDMKAHREFVANAAAALQQHAELLEEVRAAVGAANRRLLAVERENAALKQRVAAQEAVLADLRLALAAEREARAAADRKLTDGLSAEFARLLQESVRQAAPPAPEPVAGEVYVVRKGDTLDAIGRAFGVSVDGLMKANGLTNHIIRIDQKLVIPR